MKRNILFATAMLLAGSLLAADSDNDAVKAAAKKTAESGYSWKQTVANANGGGGRAGGGPREGKVAKDGTVFLSMTGRNNNTTEVYIKGEKVAIKGQDGWQSLEEAQAAAANNNNGGNGGARRGGGRFAMYKNYKAPASRIDEVIATVKDLKTADGVVSGDLTEDGAKALLTFGGRGRGGNGNGPEISGAKGSVKFWIKDGALVKTEYHVQGTITRNGQDNDVDRTTTTEFNDVGATTVTVPDEASKKLS